MYTPQGFELKKIELLLSALKESVSRSRKVFFGILLAASVVFVAIFNSTYSWNRHINAEERFNFALVNKFIKKTTQIDSLEKQLLRLHNKRVSKNESISDIYALINKGDTTEFVASEKKIIDKLGTELQTADMKRKFIELHFSQLTFTIPILGIQCSSFDLSLLASLGMSIIMIWFYMSERKTRQIIEHLNTCIKEIKKREKEEGISPEFMQWVYCSAALDFILNPISNKRIGLLLKMLIYTLHYLPSIIILMTITSDIYSLCVHKKLLYLYYNEIYPREIIAFVCFLFCSSYSYIIVQFLDENKQDISDFLPTE
jgi:uncharacterized protein involved in tolerance to divalent cations